jgi:hypothetical protein
MAFFILYGIVIVIGVVFLAYIYVSDKKTDTSTAK